MQKEEKVINFSKLMSVNCIICSGFPVNSGILTAMFSLEHFKFALYLGCWKLDIEILKEAKNAQK